MQNNQELKQIIMQGRPDLPEATVDKWVYYLSQLKGCSVQSVIAQSVDETGWLNARRSGIGGSEIAAIAGRSPWRTAYQVWMDKTGQLDELENKQSEAARWGNLLETTVADEWAVRNNKKYINIAVILRDDEHPFMFANIDGFTLSDDGQHITGILEVKTTSAYNSDTWEFGPLPEYYLCQANWYTRITGLPGFTIICLVGGQKLFGYEFPLNHELVTELRQYAIDFWHINVKQLVAPEIKAGDTDDLKAAAAEVPDDTPTAVLDDDGTENLVEAYCNLRAKIKELSDVKDIVYAQLMGKMQGIRSAITQTHALDIQVSNRRSCNWERLASAYPEAYKDCVETKASVSLRIS